MTKTEEAITDYWGPRCPDSEPGCPVCDAWAEYDALASERKAIVKWLRTLSDPGSTFQDRRLAYQMAAEQFADALEAGEHLK